MPRLDISTLAIGLRGQIEAETDRGAYWLAARDSDKRVAIKEVGLCKPMIAQRVFAIELLNKLNDCAALDGGWVVAWADPQPEFTPPAIVVMRPTRLIMLWKDPDGDANIAVDNEDDALEDGVDACVEAAVAAWQQARAIERDVDIRPRDKRKAALGEGPADPRIGARAPLT